LRTGILGTSRIPNWRQERGRFNRNFPFHWDSTNNGAESFSNGTAETQAIIDFARQAPHIVAWADLHSFGGILIRPPFSSEDDFDPFDARIYTQIGAAIETAASMPTISALDDLTPDRKKR